MRALIFDGNEPSLTASQPEPRPGEGEALIRPLKAAVTDLEVQVCRGLFAFRGVLGHQFVGVVESIDGEAGADLAGRRVVGAIDAVCGACDLCRSGLAAHCRERTILGLRGRDGCLADRFTLPASNLVPLPDGVDDDHAVFAGLLAAALQPVRQLTIEGKPYITVLGDGALALLTVQVMSRLNASVRLVGRNPEKLAVCEKWGVKHRQIDDVGFRTDQDIVVDCTESPEGLALAMEMARPRGKIVTRTLCRRNGHPPVDLAPLVINELELIGSAGGPVRSAVAMLERNEVDVLSLLGRRMRLDDGPAILHAAADDDQLHVVVDV